MICEPSDVVVVPFPFTEGPRSKRRPDLALSTKAFNKNGYTILAMITTKAHHTWQGDTDIEDHPPPRNLYVCHRLVVKQIGHLAENDREKTSEHLHIYFI